MRRVHGLSSIKLLAIPAKTSSIWAVLVAATIVLTAPTAWGQNAPAPSANTDCLQICKEGFNTQLTDEAKKKVFAECVLGNKCSSAVTVEPPGPRKQNPLLGPFQR
jgi:hypothetical protein